jgi:hypothetical protein
MRANVVTLPSLREVLLLLLLLLLLVLMILPGRYSQSAAKKASACHSSEHSRSPTYDLKTLAIMITMMTIASFAAANFVAFNKESPAVTCPSKPP